MATLLKDTPLGEGVNRGEPFGRRRTGRGPPRRGATALTPLGGGTAGPDRGQEEPRATPWPRDDKTTAWPSRTTGRNMAERRDAEPSPKYRPHPIRESEHTAEPFWGRGPPSIPFGRGRVVPRFRRTLCSLRLTPQPRLLRRRTGPLRTTTTVRAMRTTVNHDHYGDGPTLR